MINLVPIEWVVYKYLIIYLYNFIKNYIVLAFFQSSRLVFICQKDFIYILIKFFQKHSTLKFLQLLEIAVKDSIGFVYRFFLNYLLYSKTRNISISITTLITEYTILPSITTVFLSANWFENEIWEFFGLYFISKEGNIYTKRLLTDYGFTGFPLRKDFPLIGFEELIYIPALNRFEVLDQGTILFLQVSNIQLVYFDLF